MRCVLHRYSILEFSLESLKWYRVDLMEPHLSRYQQSLRLQTQSLYGLSHLSAMVDWDILHLELYIMQV